MGLSKLKKIIKENLENPEWLDNILDYIENSGAEVEVTNVVNSRTYEVVINDVEFDIVNLNIHKPSDNNKNSIPYAVKYLHDVPEAYNKDFIYLDRVELRPFHNMKGGMKGFIFNDGSPFHPTILFIPQPEFKYIYFFKHN